MNPLTCRPTGPTIEGRLANHKSAMEHLERQMLPQITLAIRRIIEAINDGKKVLIAGNGGSAADAQHFATELAIRYKRDRQALPAIALTTDTSLLTACANDFGYQNVFSRQVKAIGEEGDILILISTSGGSENIEKAMLTAVNRGLEVIFLGGMNEYARMTACSYFPFPNLSFETAAIQEAHEFILHTIAQAVEDSCFCEDLK